MRKYGSTHRNPSFIFPAGKNPDQRFSAKQYMDRGGLQKSIRVICKDCGINKHIYVHSLRHCYGAHLVESGLNLRAIQHEMGHECPKTTAIYTQLTDVTRQKTDAIINRMIKRLNIRLDGEV
jgi:site-specific recombinase XerD